ncbi:MAG: hypothetical protein J07HR59_00752 [Halorubrum sp. J07HR59]|nr:MAG: hypothetical protein J07HR59_00752 [Halorubrum sp. J07HR59]
MVTGVVRSVTEAPTECVDELLPVDDVVTTSLDVTSGHGGETGARVHLDHGPIVADERLGVDMPEELSKTARHIAVHELMDPLAGLRNLGVSVQFAERPGTYRVDLFGFGPSDIVPIEQGDRAIIALCGRFENDSDTDLITDDPVGTVEVVSHSGTVPVDDGVEGGAWMLLVWNRLVPESRSGGAGVVRFDGLLGRDCITRRLVVEHFSGTNSSDPIDPQVAVFQSSWIDLLAGGPDSRQLLTVSDVINGLANLLPVGRILLTHDPPPN